MIEIRLTKDRATWFYYTKNSLGGGFGSTYCGPQYIALARASQNIKSGEQYRLIVNGKDRGVQVMK